MARPYAMLREVLRDNEMTGAELAEELGLSSSSISLRMNAHLPWTASEMWAIMHMFDIPAKRFHEVFPDKGINEADVNRRPVYLRKKGATA